MTISELASRKKWVGWLLFVVTVVVVFGAGIFAASVIERRTEGMVAYLPKNNLDTWEADNEKWGKVYPRQYDGWKATLKGDFRSLYNGSGMNDALAEDPRMVILWAGYAFAKDYSDPRGHANAIADITNTLRTGAPMSPAERTQPGTCWTCKSPDVPRLMAKMGPAEFYHKTWAELGPEVTHAIGCADCHNPEDMTLRISRPALEEALNRKGKDLKEAKHQEMRSLVCAQCHVEYYFKGDGKYLTFPWDKGTTVDKIEEYYDSIDFTDWVHAISKTPMLKAQHPDYELFLTGIHAQRGVSCADCHMPYKSEGGVKFSDHQVRSPLANINASCQNCHRESEATLTQNVYERQTKIQELRLRAEDLLVKTHFEAKKSWELGASDAEMKPALTQIRHAQWRWDFAVAGHGSSFHAPLEVARILAGSIDLAQEARATLAKIRFAHGFAGDVVTPDVSTKDKAQQVIGLDMNKLREEKDKFLKGVAPRWTDRQKENE